MTLEATEATAPRVSLDDIKANVAAAYIFKASDAMEALDCPVNPSLEVLTICIMVTKNGFTVIGKAAPVSPENFDADHGKKLAEEDAVRQLWPLMGYALREKLAADK